MTDAERSQLCRKKQDASALTQRELDAWVESNLARKSRKARFLIRLSALQNCLLPPALQNKVGNPIRLSTILYWKTRFWVVPTYQGEVAMSRELLKSKGAFFPRRLYPDAYQLESSKGWLDYFKSQYGIESYGRFGESGSVDIVSIEQARPGLREILNKYELKDIYNIDETGLFIVCRYLSKIDWCFINIE